LAGFLPFSVLNSSKNPRGEQMPAPSPALDGAHDGKTKDSELNGSHIARITDTLNKCHISFFSVKGALQGRIKTFIQKFILISFSCMILALQFRFPEAVTKEASTEGLLRSLSFTSNFDGGCYCNQAVNEIVLERQS
jgi:hypothetical protein